MIISALEHSSGGALKSGGYFDLRSLLHSRQFPLYWPGNWKKTLIMNLRNILLKGSLGVFALALFASIQAQSITFTSDNYPGESGAVLTFNGETILDLPTAGTLFGADCFGAGCTETLSLTGYGTGDYTLTFYDSWGDGGPSYTVDGGDLACSGDCVGGGPGTWSEISYSFSIISGVPGCTDETALNYNADATDDDGSCFYDACPGDAENMAFVVLEDSWGDGWNGNTYEILADGVVIASGGLDAGSFAVDTVCLPFGACYSINAGGGSFVSEISWTLNDAITGETIAAQAGGGITEFYYGDVADGVCGCTDNTALNYNDAATIDDGSCVSAACGEGETLVQFNMIDACGVGWSGSVYTLTDGNGVIVASGGLATPQFEVTPGSLGYDLFCLSNTECYTLEISGGQYAGCKEWQILDYTTGDMLYNQNDGNGFGVFGVAGPGVVCGCSDASAYNYNADATVDDGSCFLPSCDGTDSTSYILRLTHDVYLNWGNNAAYIYEAGGDTVLSAGYVDFIYSPDFEVTPVEGLYEFCVANDACLQLAAGGGATFGQALWDIMDFSGNVIHSGSLGVSDIGFGSSEGNCVPGCTLTSAINYDPLATVNDGSCEVCDNGALGFFLTLQDDFGNGWINGSYYLVAEATGDTVFTGGMDQGPSTVEIVNCLEVGCYTFSTDELAASQGWAISDNLGNEYTALQYGGTEGFPISFPPVIAGEVNDCGFSGCTDPLGNNYNISATVDDGSCIFPPANDSPETATAIACGMSLSGTLENANGDEYNGTTVLGNSISNSGAVWYEFNADADYQASFNTCQSAYTNDGNGITDTDIIVFVENPDGSLTAIATNDDSGIAGCGSNPSGSWNSLVSFNAIQGQNYFLRVGKYSEFTFGTGIVVEAECASCPSGFPTNDDICTLALPLVDGGSYDGGLCCSGPDEDFGLSGLSTFATAYGVWFEVETSTDFNLYNITVDATGAGAVGYGLYSGTDCSDLNDLAGGVVAGSVQDDMNQWFGGVTDDGPATVELSQPSADLNYYLFVWTTQTDACDSFNVTSSGEITGCTDPIATNYDENATVNNGCIYTGVVQANDSCSNAVAVACGETVAGNTGGSTAAGGDNPCGTSGAGVWYTLDNDYAEQLITISTCDSETEASFEVFQEVDIADATLEVTNLNNDNIENISAAIYSDGVLLDSIPAGDLLPTIFQNYYYPLYGGDYTVYFYNSADGELDGIAATVIASDGSAQNLLCSGGCSTEPQVCVDLQINTDFYPEETSWIIQNSAGDVVAEGAPAVGNASVTETICLPAGDYVLSVFDSWGDGIFGTGDVNLTTAAGEGLIVDGEVASTMSSWGFSLEASPFNFPAGSVVEQSFTIFGGTGLCSSLLCWTDGANTAVSSESCDNGETFQFISDDNAGTYAILVAAGSSNPFGGPFNLSVTCEPVVYGCQDALACNYNSEANVDDPNAPCDFTSCLGCEAETWEYCYDNGENWSFTLNNINGGGTIVIDLAGTAIESFYDELVISDAATGVTLYSSEDDADDSVVIGTDSVTVSFTSDGSVSCPSFGISMAITCAPAPATGCADEAACNYSGPVDFADNSLCDYSCLGCTDPAATNYDPFATIDDGTCCSGTVLEFNMFDSFGDGWNGATYSFYNSANELVATGGLTTDDNGGAFGTDVLCFDVAECVTLIVTEGSWPGEISWSVTSGFTVIATADAGEATGTFSVGAECVEGCVLPFATNYIDPAEVDIVNNDLCDFTGYVMGCTYVDATNYDETATNDDGSCEFDVANPCPTDLNGDNQTTTSDLLIFLGAFGTEC